MGKVEDLKYKFQRLSLVTMRYFKRNFGRVVKDYSEITQYSGTSPLFGKREAISFIEKVFPDKESKILDVGPGRGIYNKLLRERGYKHIDAVEIYLPYIEKFELKKIYSEVFHCDIVGFKYTFYDVAIMGDVIEHLRVKQAQKVLSYAQEHCDLILVAVPYQMKQIGSQLDGSGDHRQPDLTRELFLHRYPGFKLLIDNRQLGVFYFKRTS